MNTVKTSVVAFLFVAGLLSSANADNKRARTVELTVTEKGFEPTPVKVKKGEPLELVVTRKTDKTCATAIVVKDYDIKKTSRSTNRSRSPSRRRRAVSSSTAARWTRWSGAS